MRTRSGPLALAATLLLAVAARGTAQESKPEGLVVELRPFVEVRPIIGGYIATGGQRGTLHDGPLFGAQLAFEVRRRVHLVGSFSYIPTETGGVQSPHDRVHLFQYDVGAELNTALRGKANWTPKPFVGAGVGRRTYKNLDRDVGRGYPTVHGAVGVEYQTEVIGVRLEVRDYVSRFAGYDGSEPRGVRNDIALMAGVAYHIR